MAERTLMAEGSEVEAIARRRGKAMAELPDAAGLMRLAEAVRAHTLNHLDVYLEQFLEAARAGGAAVHLAADEASAQRIVSAITSASENPLAGPPCVAYADFLVADSGAAVLLRDDASLDPDLAGPRPLVLLAGIDQLLPRLADLVVMLKLAARSRDGRTMTARTHLLAGPGRSPEIGGPRPLHVVLIDGDRSAALASELGREMLRCIRCDACLSVAGMSGSRASNDGFVSPLQAVRRPLANAVHAIADRDAAGALAARCRDACPVRIDLVGQLASAGQRQHRQPPRASRSLWQRLASWLGGSRRGPAADDVLARVRASLARARPAAGETVIPPELPEPIVRLVHSDFGLCELFVARAREAEMDASLVGLDELFDRVADALASRGVRRVGHCRGGLIEKLDLPAGLRRRGFEVRAGDEIAGPSAAAIDAALIDVAAAVAETGTLVLGGTPGERRALASSAPLCVAVLEPRNMISDLVDLADRLAGDLPPPLTLLSGGPAAAEPPREVRAFVLH
jgi:L-lactate utilization protein LutC